MIRRGPRGHNAVLLSSGTSTGATTGRDRTRRFTARHSPAGGSTVSLPGPSRPDPQSQSLSRSYGSNLPTSLTYIILSTRGFSPWRPAADMGTIWREASSWPSPGFSRSEGKIPTPLQLRCSSRSKPYLPSRGFQGTRTLMQKRKLFRDLPTASPGSLGLPRRTLLRGPEYIYGSAARFRNVNRIPFRTQRD